MKFQVLHQGFISRRVPGTPTSCAAGARCVVTGDKEVLCSFIVQAALGGNDFQPVLARSTDGGLTWSEAVPIWPELRERWSIFGSISAAPNRDLLFFGSRTPIDRPGESFWSDATQGIKQNELIWSRSADAGRTWAPLRTIPMPIPGSAEAPGPLCALRDGSLVCCYAPYSTFDPALRVDRHQIVALRSSDGGRSWTGTSMLRFPDSDSSGAEAWVIQLADGRLLGTSWHIRTGADPANAYALSADGGKTWSATASTGIFGQSTALAALPDGRALFAYNQRKQGEIGVWLALVNPTATNFGVEVDQPVWKAEIAAHKEGATGHSTWTDFAFGEPSVTVLPDGTFLLALWAAQPSGVGIPYVHLRLA